MPIRHPPPVLRRWSFIEKFLIKRNHRISTIFRRRVAHDVLLLWFRGPCNRNWMEWYGKREMVAIFQQQSNVEESEEWQWQECPKYGEWRMKSHYLEEQYRNALIFSFRNGSMSNICTLGQSILHSCKTMWANADSVNNSFPSNHQLGSYVGHAYDALTYIPALAVECWSEVDFELQITGMKPLIKFVAKHQGDADCTCIFHIHSVEMCRIK